MRTLGKKSKTSRGFAIIEFEDLYGHKCSLQESSLATDDAVWLGQDESGEFHCGTQLSPRMHLNKEQVILLVKHLNSWIKTGKF